MLFILVTFRTFHSALHPSFRRKNLHRIFHNDNSSGRLAISH